MVSGVRMTRNVRAVLASLLAAPGPCHVRFGYEIVRETGLTSGSVYPVLHRLEEDGWLVSGEEPSGTRGRPPRRCYRFTDLGRAEAAKALTLPSEETTNGLEAGVPQEGLEAHPTERESAASRVGLKRRAQGEGLEP
jgi:PadR family transcriptional regulator PadR